MPGACLLAANPLPAHKATASLTQLYESVYCSPEKTEYRALQPVLLLQHSMEEKPRNCTAVRNVRAYVRACLEMVLPKGEDLSELSFWRSESNHSCLSLLLDAPRDILLDVSPRMSPAFADSREMMGEKPATQQSKKQGPLPALSLAFP